MSFLPQKPYPPNSGTEQSIVPPIVFKESGDVPVFNFAWLPDLREEIAQCERVRQMHDACRVHCVGLTDDYSVTSNRALNVVAKSSVRICPSLRDLA